MGTQCGLQIGAEQH